MKRPGLAGPISERAGDAQRQAERAYEVEPAEQEREQRREVAGDPKRFLMAASSIQPFYESNKRVDLVGDDLRVERVALGDRVEQAQGLLASRSDSGGVFQQLVRSRCVALLDRRAKRLAKLVRVLLFRSRFEQRE